MLRIFALLAYLAPLICGSAPTVRLDDATVIGTSDGVSTSYLGIPFAEAPCVLMNCSFWTYWLTTLRV